MTADGFIAALLSVVLMWAGALNVFAPAFIRAEFSGWGYPDWLRVAVGLTEWAAAIALSFASMRLIGCALAAIVLFGVIVTFLRDGQRMRLEYPLVLLALVLWLGARSTGVV